MEDQYTADMSTCLAPAYNHIYKDICKETIDCLPKSHMMVSPSQALFLHHLVKMLRPNNILEIGGFTGASAVAMGAALPSKGRLLSLELDPEPLEIAKRNVEASVLKDKIKFQLGPALDR
jgi:predicted O-methyltransferase YrrM